MDEGWVLAASTFDAFRSLLAEARKVNSGLVLVIMGDPNQLPPIGKGAQMLDKSEAWKQDEFAVFHLTAVERQDKEDDMVTQLIQEMCECEEVSDDVLDWLVRRIAVTKPIGAAIRKAEGRADQGSILYAAPLSAAVDAYNKKILDSLPGEQV